MQPPQQPPPGWYPDPAGGAQARYWDGTQWSMPTTAPVQTNRGRRRVRKIVVVVAIAFAVLCVAPCAFIASQLGPNERQLAALADELALPPDFTMVHETARGNQICLDQCLTLQRTYVTILSNDDTQQVMVGVLRDADYECVPPYISSVDRDWCGPFEPGILSYWRRDDSYYISLNVGLRSDPSTPTVLRDVTVDWQSYIDIDLRLGTP
jgi:hypothetical protein